MSRISLPALCLLFTSWAVLSMPAMASSAGVSVRALGLVLETAQGGVRIASLDNQAAAHRAGARQGDMILEVDGISVLKASPVQVKARILAPRLDALRLLVRRAGGGQQELRLHRPDPDDRPGPDAAPDGTEAPRLTDEPRGPRSYGPLPLRNGARATREVPVPGPQSAGRADVVSQAAVVVGDEFIDFTLPRLGGGEVTLHDLLGKPIFLDFWATWCAPCRAEAPGLAAIYKRYGDTIQMLGISLDSSAAAPLEYAMNYGLGYPHLLAPGSWKDPVVQAYGIHRTGIPFNILMDARGRIVAMDLHGQPLARAMQLLTAGAGSR